MRHLAALLLILASLAVTLPVSAQEQAPAVPADVAPEVLARGRAAVDAENFEQSIVDFSLYILLNPTDPRGYYLRALSYYTLQDLDSAVDDLTHGLRYSEAIPELHASLLATRSEFYVLLGDDPSAITDLDALIAIRPSPEAFAQRAILRLSGSAFEEAVADLNEAIDLTTDSQPALYFYRAHAQDALQNQRAAASDYLAWVNGIRQQTADEGPLESGGAVTLQMAQSRVYSIAFDADQGDEISVLVRAVAGDIDPLLVILAPDGTPLVGNDDARVGRDTNAVVIGYEAPSAGAYHLLVTHSISGYNGRVQVLLETR